jgi:hypothetical protein
MKLISRVIKENQKKKKPVDIRAPIEIFFYRKPCLLRAIGPVQFHPWGRSLKVDGEFSRL